MKAVGMNTGAILHNIHRNFYGKTRTYEGADYQFVEAEPAGDRGSGRGSVSSCSYCRKSHLGNSDAELGQNLETFSPSTQKRKLKQLSELSSIRQLACCSASVDGLANA